MIEADDITRELPADLDYAEERQTAREIRELERKAAWLWRNNSILGWWNAAQSVLWLLTALYLSGAGALGWAWAAGVLAVLCWVAGYLIGEWRVK